MEGRTNLNTVENRWMNNCAAAAVRGWPGAGGVLLTEILFHIHGVSFLLLLEMISSQVSVCLPVLCLQRHKNARLQWAFPGALWWSRPFQVTFVNRIVCVLAGSSLARARAAMPFGCLTLGEKKDYNNPSEVTDKYDLGQVVKSWVHQHWKANVWLNKGTKTRSSFFWQRGILWDIPGQR